MPDPHTVLLANIKATYGALPDMRIWDNKTMGVWVGEKVGTTQGGHVVLKRARFIKVGLYPGSPDLVGIAPGGLFLGIEGKTGKARANRQQKQSIELINDLGGLAGVVRDLEDVEKLLKRSKPFNHR